MNDIDKDEIERVILQRIQWHMGHRFDAEYAHSIDASVFKDEIPGTFVIHMTKSVFAHIHDGPTITYPKDWWQAFKLRWLPGWTLKRWPVEYTKHVISLREIYPAIKPQIPQEDVIFQVVRNVHTP